MRAVFRDPALRGEFHQPQVDSLRRLRRRGLLQVSLFASLSGHGGVVIPLDGDFDGVGGNQDA